MQNGNFYGPHTRDLFPYTCSFLHTSVQTIKRLSIGLSLFFLLANCSVQADQPKIEFDADTYTFGRLPVGSIIQHDFVISNVGNAALTISNAVPSCTCTRVSGWTRQIPPGETGVVSVKVKPPAIPGPIEKTVAIQSNDKSQPWTVLNIQGTLYHPIEAVPQNIFFHINGDHPATESMSLRVTNNLNVPVTIEGVEIDNPSLNADWRTVQAGKEFEVTVTAHPPFSPANSSAMLKIKTSSSAMPFIEVPVFTVIHSMLVVMPSRVMVPPGPLPNPWTCTVTIRNDSGQLMELADPTCELKGVDLTIKEVSLPRYQVDDITDLSGFATRLQERRDPVSAFLWSRLGPQLQDRLIGKPPPRPPTIPLGIALVEFLNRQLDSATLHESKCFEKLSLRPATKFLLANQPSGDNLHYLNRLLLDDAYPALLSRAVEPGHHFELTATFPKGFELAEGDSEITIKSNRRQDPLIRVPIVAANGGQWRGGAHALNGSTPKPNIHRDQL
jgi:hypothetical protein